MALVLAGTLLGLVAMGAALAMGQPVWLGLVVLSSLGTGTVLVWAALAHRLLRPQRESRA